MKILFQFECGSIEELARLRAALDSFAPSSGTGPSEEATRESVVEAAADEVVFAPVDEDPELPAVVAVVAISPAPLVEGKRPRGRPRKDASVAPTAAATLPAPVAPDAPPSGKDLLPDLGDPCSNQKTVPTREDVVQALEVLNRAHGIVVCRSLLEQYGAKSVSALPADKYPSFLEACARRLAPPPQSGESVQEFLS